jgi:hypothetical protein
MTTFGFFQQQLTPNFRIWFCDENVRYIMSQVTKRLAEKYTDKIEIEYDRAYNMLLHTYSYWRGPLDLDQLLEMTICDFVTDIDTDIQWRNRFNHFDPRRLYKPDSDITMQEKVKLKPGYKLTFQMNY